MGQASTGVKQQKSGAAGTRVEMKLEVLMSPDPKRTSYGSFRFFSDPDGNAWMVQEVTTRLPGRIDGPRNPGDFH